MEALEITAGGSEAEKVHVELLAQVAQGSESALAAMYDATSRMVYGLALRITGDAAIAEDIMIEVFLQVWRTAATYDPLRAPVVAWLVTLTRSRSIDWLRSRKRTRPEIESPLDSDSILPCPRPGPEQAGLEQERARQVRAALVRLSPEQREAIELAFFSGLSHSEIAAKTGLRLGTVKTRIRLGMMRMQEMLRPQTGALRVGGTAASRA